MYLDLKRQKQLGVTFNTDEHKVVLTVNFIIKEMKCQRYILSLCFTISALHYFMQRRTFLMLIFPKS